MLTIGIDTGKHTGIAVLDNGELIYCKTLPIHKALEAISSYALRDSLTVIVEDARKRKWIPKDANAQGAGSVKRDASIWEDFLKDKHIDYKMVPPRKGRTKWSPEKFKAVTGWSGQTSEHSRDAAVLAIEYYHTYGNEIE